MTTSPTIEISIQQQTLQLLDSGSVIATYPISSSKNGIGFEFGSYCTPTGSFVICEKIGADAPIYTVFKSRQPVGVWDPELPPLEDDLITTRILWLDGTEPDNSNSMLRYIYIHGTNHEDSIGKPASCGCIRMNNADIIELFELVSTGTAVFIH